MNWYGTVNVAEPTMEPIDTYEDHRMAMAFAPAAIKYPGLKINNPQVVSKSYPKFWEDMRERDWKTSDPSQGDCLTDAKWMSFSTNIFEKEWNDN